MVKIEKDDISSKQLDLLEDLAYNNLTVAEFVKRLTDINEELIRNAKQFDFNEFKKILKENKKYKKFKLYPHEFSHFRVWKKYGWDETDLSYIIYKDMPAIVGEAKLFKKYNLDEIIKILKELFFAPITEGICNPACLGDLVCYKIVDKKLRCEEINCDSKLKIMEEYNIKP